MMVNVFHQRSGGQDEGENDARTVESSMDLKTSN